MSTRISRRTVTAGAALSVPAIAVASAAPAYAASCNTTAIDAAFKTAEDQFKCNGVKPKFELWWDQGVSATDGNGTSVWLNRTRVNGCPVTFTDAKPMVIKLEIISLDNTDHTRGANWNTSWGSWTATTMDGKTYTAGDPG